jgi:hypothetical protein
MAIDVTNDFDIKVLRRISNLEERIKDIFTAQQQFASSLQLTELLSAITVELKTMNETLNSLEKRISIIENNPDLD